MTARNVPVQTHITWHLGRHATRCPPASAGGLLCRSRARSREQVLKNAQHQKAQAEGIRGDPPETDLHSLGSRLGRASCTVCFIPWVQDPHLEMVVHQEAVGVDREVTNWREPLTSKGRRGRFSESVGHNVSERRASLENVSRGSRPAVRTGKATAAGDAQPVLQWFHRGNGDGTRQGEEHAITRDPPLVSGWRTTGSP